jgi:hypothetical protein
MNQWTTEVVLSSEYNAHVNEHNDANTEGDAFRSAL